MADPQNVTALLDEMRASMTSTRELIHSLNEKQSDDLDTRDGISLLSVKHHLVLFYIQSLVLLLARRAVGDTLENRTPASLPFSTLERDARGAGVGDLVDSMIEGRVVLEKVKVLESRISHQIDKLVRIADADDASKNVADDLLAFRPNPQNLVNNDQASDAVSDGDDDAAADNRDGIYKPPKLAPMPYTENAGDRRSKRQPVPKTLSTLLRQDPSRPHIESSSGLGAMPSLASDRAREIQRMSEFEEENFTRLMMNKKDAQRRRRDEADLALGGVGSSHGRRRGRDLEYEFEDVLRSVGRATAGAVGDGYEELRRKGKKADALSRSRTRVRDDVEEGEDDVHVAKRSRFQRERRALSRKTAKARRR